MKVKAGKFWTVSKGKEQTGALPEAAIEVAGLPLRAPLSYF